MVQIRVHICGILYQRRRTRATEERGCMSTRLCARTRKCYSTRRLSQTRRPRKMRLPVCGVCLECDMHVFLPSCTLCAEREVFSCMRVFVCAYVFVRIFVCVCLCAYVCVGMLLAYPSAYAGELWGLCTSGSSLSLHIHDL
jgi:hypothetical protein